MVPAWSLALAFVVGLAIGAVACRLVMGRSRSASVAPAAPPEPVPAAEPAPEPAAAPEPEPAAASAEAEAATEAPAGVEAEAGEEQEGESEEGESEEGESEDPAAAVDDVVAELERRVKGRRVDGETDRANGGRRGRRV